VPADACCVPLTASKGSPGRLRQQTGISFELLVRHARLYERAAAKFPQVRRARKAESRPNSLPPPRLPGAQRAPASSRNVQAQKSHKRKQDRIKPNAGDDPDDVRSPALPNLYNALAHGELSHESSRYGAVRLSQDGWEVLGADLNCSESGRRSWSADRPDAGAGMGAAGAHCAGKW
jgi:hypothetical protein